MRPLVGQIVHAVEYYNGHPGGRQAAIVVRVFDDNRVNLHVFHPDGGGTSGVFGAAYTSEPDLPNQLDEGWVWTCSW